MTGSGGWGCSLVGWSEAKLEVTRSSTEYLLPADSLPLPYYPSPYDNTYTHTYIHTDTTYMLNMQFRQSHHIIPRITSPLIHIFTLACILNGPQTWGGLGEWVSTYWRPLHLGERKTKNRTKEKQVWSIPILLLLIEWVQNEVNLGRIRVRSIQLVSLDGNAFYILASM